MADQDASVKTGEDAGQGQAGEDQGQGGAAATNAAESNAGNAGAGAGQPPRRNADYWERETQREKDRQARAEFFKTKNSKKSDGTDDGTDDGAEAPLTRAEVQDMLESKAREQELRDREQGDEISISSFLSDPKNAGFKKYESQARAFLKAHPYVPIETAFYHYAYPDALAEGAKRGANAEDRNARRAVRGDTRRPAAGGGFPDLKGKTPAERTAALKDFKGKMRRGQASLSPESDE